MPERIDALFSADEMAEAFSLEAHVRGMLAFEAAFALAEARAGVIPQDAANIIADKRMMANVDLTQGLIMAESLTKAFAPHVGRPEAQWIVKTLFDES